MRILFDGETSGTGSGGGGGSTASPNEARIQLVIEAPDKKNFAGIDAATNALTKLQAQVDAVNASMKSIGIQSFREIKAASETVETSSKKITSARKEALQIAKTDLRVVNDGVKAQKEAESVRERAAKVDKVEVKQRIGELKKLSTEEKKRAEEKARTDLRVINDGVKAQKEAERQRREALIRDSKSQFIEDQSAAKQDYSRSVSGLTHSSGPHKDRVAKEEAKRALQQDLAKAALAYHARSKASGDIAGQQSALKAYSTALVGIAEASRMARIETSRLNESYSHIGKNMLQNVAHVTAWSAAVGTLYGSLRVLKESVGTMIELQYQQARLSVVMGLSQSETNGLTDDILRLAAANGRSGDDAMRAATQWARLGMTKRQVAEATRVSMVAANVAELTAAEATESLSSLMVTYNLRAEQLNGVLGMLNQTSNTYNVTVGELLNGLERVSVVSKQAGLSLAETQGIIGAAAGATGQTGANIGNALKSFIGAVSGEEGQKTLRSFGIEPTAGGELKDMTQIINDMYVAYQRMSAAEQRTMIFSTVGKNQASRVTAMLDNYVKSQVLAVNSLQNLNSAGAENEVILSTMKAQLQGVITEWMRFVSLQGKHFGKIGTFGGVAEDNQASGLMKAVSNIGKLANTSGGSWATTAALGVLTATLMRMGVASYTASRGSAEWSQRGGVMKETAKAVSSSINDLRMTLIRAAIPAANMTTAMNNMSVAGRRVAMVVGGLRLAGIGILQMAGGMAAATVVFGAFNKVVEELMKLTGNDADQISERGDALADMANTAGRAAESYATAARLFQTSADAIANSANPKGTMSSILSQVSGLDDAIPGVEQRLKAASGSVVEFTRVLNDLKLESKGKQWLEQADSINKMNASIAIYKAKLESLRAGEGVMTAGGRQKDIAEMEKKIKQAQDERFKTVQANQARMKEEVKEQFEQSVNGAAFLERQKILVSEISDLYKELGANSDHSTQQTLEIMRLDTMTGLYREQIGLLTARKKAAQDKLSEAFKADDPTVAIQGKVKLINDQIDDAKARLLEQVQESSNRGVSRSGGGYYRAADGSLRNRADDIREEISRLKNQRERLTKSITERQNNDPLRQQINADSQAIASLNKNLQEAESRRKALNDQEERALRLAESRFRIQTYSSLEKTAIEASATGEDEFDKWESRKNYLRSRLDAFSTEDATQGQRLQALAQANALINSGVDALTKQAELEGKAKQHATDRTKEYRKQLMMMGPGELLRELAISKMAPNMTGGQLLALGPEARGRVMAMPGNDPQSREMAAAIAKFKALGLTPETVIGDKMGVTRKIRNDILPGIDSTIQDALKGTAGEVVAGLEVKTMNVNAGNVNLNAGGGGVPGRASGGPVEKGKTYMVGEKGPELVKMGGSGAVVDAESTKQWLFDRANKSQKAVLSGIQLNTGQFPQKQIGKHVAGAIDYGWNQYHVQDASRSFGLSNLGGVELKYNQYSKRANTIESALIKRMMEPVQNAKKIELLQRSLWRYGTASYGALRRASMLADQVIPSEPRINIQPQETASTPKSELDAIKNTFKSQRQARTPTMQSAPAEIPLPSRSAVPTDTLAGGPKSNIPIDRGYINAKLRNTTNPNGLLLSGAKSAIGESMLGKIGRGIGKFGMGMINPAGILTEGAFGLAHSGVKEYKDIRLRQLKEREVIAASIAKHNLGSDDIAGRLGINEPNVGDLAKNPVSDFKLPEIEPKDDSPTGPEGAEGSNALRRYSIPFRRNQKPNRNIQPIYRPPPAKPAPVPARPIAKPVAFDNPSSSGQGQGGGSFPAVMAAASAAVGAFSGAISAATANVSMFSQALTQAMANLTPKTAFASPPMNADNPFA